MANITLEALPFQELIVFYDIIIFDALQTSFQSAPLLQVVFTYVSSSLCNRKVSFTIRSDSSVNKEEQKTLKVVYGTLYRCYFPMFFKGIHES